MQQLEQFFHTAHAFCHWAESSVSLPEREAATAIKLLSQLCAQVHDIPELFDEEDAPPLPHEAWQLIYKRFAALPFNYYSTYCEPHDLDDPVPAIGDLADDLADIWRDLKGGIALYTAGNHAAAAWEWRESFNIHWGRHATGALNALQCWRS
jgi:hypothetical protein